MITFNKPYLTGNLDRTTILYYLKNLEKQKKCNFYLHNL
jgi:hypothetical protein